MTTSPTAAPTPPAVSEMLEKLSLEVSDWLKTVYPGRDIPARLTQSMEYSLLAGGKRLRPVLCLMAALACNNHKNKQESQSSLLADAELKKAVMPFAAALELIHTYSLVHDDLPAMDDDDLRRGMPSNHKAFDEATAILAGDGLLTDAFQLMASCPLPPERVVSAIHLASLAAGPEGMVGGQILDMEGETKQLSQAQLKELNARKTGALIRTACECGATLAGASSELAERLKTYGAELGIAFQITDDILDVIGDAALLGKKPGSDTAQNKSTWPALLGLEQAKILAQQHSEAACAALEPELFPGEAGHFLRQLALFLISRTH